MQIWKQRLDHLTQAEDSFNTVMTQVIIEKKTAFETKEGTGAGNVERGLQCVFLHWQGYCCLEAPGKGGVCDPNRVALLTLCGYECRMCSGSDAAGVI